ncbi:MAG: hypothetical protein AB1758_10085 [Candidatus Eremiobacterota bacterium]
MVIVGVLLGLDIVLMVVAKVGLSSTPEPTFYDVVGKLEKPEAATKLKKELEAAGFTVTQSKEKGEKEVPNGFRLTLDCSEPATAESLAKTLKLQGHKVQILPGGTVLQYGGVYPKKPLADKAAATVKEKEKIVFEVSENMKVVPVMYHCLSLNGLDDEELTRAEGILNEGGAVVDKKESESTTPADMKTKTP